MSSSPGPTGTPGMGTPMPCPTGMGPCPPGMVAPAQLVQNGHYSDERFIDMMVPHHLMAIQMARVAQKHGEHIQIKQLAANIITTQGQEITELKALKQRLYGTTKTPTMMNPVQMDNTGMLMPNQLAQQHPFDKAFIDSMIPHHASAIAMASVALLRSKNPDILRIARSIVNAQSAEIGEMIQWRENWYPAGSALANGGFMPLVVSSQALNMQAPQPLLLGRERWSLELGEQCAV